MKTKRFELNKLVRDKIVAMYEKEGVACTFTMLDDDGDFLEALTQKLIEELQEVFSSEDQEELIAELADFEEVLHEFKNFLKISQKEIDAAKAKKNEANGSFKKRLYIEHIDVPLSNKERIAYQEKKEEMMSNFEMEGLDLDDLNDDEDEK